MNPNELVILKRYLPYPVLLILIMFFLPMLLVEPFEEKLNTVATEYDTQLQKARTLRRKRMTIDSANTKFARLQEIKEKAMQIIPAENELPDIIERLVELASRNLVSIDDVRYNLLPSYEGMSATAFDINMNLVASYNGMRAFLADVENITNPMIITEIVVVEGNRYSLNFKQLVK